jgi:PRTRC genetic system protein E
MFIQLSQLIAQANLSGIHLMLRPIGEGKLSVLVATESTDFRANNPALKAALAQPLNVQGNVTELDDTFSQALQHFIDSYVEHGMTNNVDDVTQGHSDAEQAQESDTDAQVNDDDEKGDVAQEPAPLNENTIITADDEPDFF